MKNERAKNPATSATSRDVPSAGSATYHRLDPRPVSYRIVVRAKGPNA